MTLTASSKIFWRHVRLPLDMTDKRKHGMESHAIYCLQSSTGFIQISRYLVYVQTQMYKCFSCLQRMANHDALRASLCPACPEPNPAMAPACCDFEVALSAVQGGISDLGHRGHASMLLGRFEGR